MIDLTGKAITELLSFTSITGIVGQRVRGEFASDEEPPAVIVEQLGIDYSPFGQTRRARLQAPTFAANCFGTTRVQAAQLGNAVAEAMELRGPRKDATGRLVYLSVVDSGGNVILDPVTRWPFATVIFTLTGAQVAVA
jgi:hypothetical protein